MDTLDPHGSVPVFVRVQLERPGTLGLQVNYTDLRLGSGGVARFPEEAGLLFGAPIRCFLGSTKMERLES